MIKKKTSLFPFLLLLLFFFSTFSFSEEKGSLEKIIISKGEKTLEVKIVLSLFTYYRQFELIKPRRVAIDFFDIKSIKAPRFLKVNEFGVRGIRTGMYRRDIARVVFDLIDEVPPYRIESTEDGLRILFWPEEKKEIIEEKIKIEDAICDIKIGPTRANLNDSIFVDMSGSQHAKSMEVEVFDKEGTKIATQKLTPESPQWQTKFDKPGEYVFMGKAFNIEDKPSENPCEAKTYINFPPVSKLECSPCKARSRRPITLDASDSTDPDGEVVKVDFEIIDEEGNLIDRFTDNEKPFAWEKAFEKKGLYTVSAVITDDFGAVSEPARVEVVAKRRRLFLIFDMTSLAARGEGTYMGYATGRIGWLYEIFPGTLDVIISGGGAYTHSGAPWNSFYTANLLFNFHIGPVFIGAGAGVTSRDLETLPNTYGEAIANIGVDMFDISITTVSIFFEALGPVTDLSFKDHHKLMLGFRLTF